ncbi:SagB family peptide dehydrogenase [Aquabacterium sp.]|uniref:SagB family peptide dehydrogenase n=1 Tax=Aquabacterium sp. TaxID=1872578 RepID=UPI002BA1959D|nr:SagB family peptide dehydrogenase [Aquabacterium sp.]HSW06505.1 SagB family peptide dehydrogenase [Aquabacterium sp.]
MPKILWVALPLLIAAVLLAVQVLRRRVPSRHAINIGASVLLLGYVAATASLGIFWVANQQLPVFDWHYLFGYGTVLLVSLHLVFNFPVVWRFFARRGRVAAGASAPGSAAQPVAAAVPGAIARRGVLGALGVAAAAGVAFVLGLRHGRTDIRIEASSAGAASGVLAPPSEAAARALALVERFHAFSSHSRAGVLLRAPGVDWGDPPPPFKHHAGAERLSLPAPGSARSVRFDLALLADLLWHTAGVTETRGGLQLRASPSSGALFSTELYVAARALPGLERGLWHYDPQGHALERLPEAAPDALPLGALDDAALHDAPALVAATAIFRRTGHKYRDRSYRYLLADLGHALENLRVAADWSGVQVRFIAAFDEARAARALGVDEAEEGVLALVAIGITRAAEATDRATPTAAAAPLASGAAAARLALGASATARWQPAPVPAAQGVPLGVTAAMHAATSMRAAAASPTAASTAASWPGLPGLPGAVLPPLVQLPAPQPLAPPWLRVIAGRRSVRRFAGTPLPLQALSEVLAQMQQQAPQLSAAVRVSVVVHAVAGLAPGAYAYLPARHALLPRRVTMALRDAARAAALDQDLIGDAAAVFVLAIDRAVLAADPLGPARGYRHAFLEAGLVGERVYLAAGARGLGACAVGGFYDDETSALVGLDPAREWVVHLAALGVKGAP